jgi:capsular polysaccharide transport system permease protein
MPNPAGSPSEITTRLVTLPERKGGGAVIDGQTIAGVATPEPPRARKNSLYLISLAIVVGLPIAVTAIYLMAIASNRYTSEFRVAIRTVEPLRGVGIPALLGLAGAGQTGTDSHAVTQYLQSWEAFAELDKMAHLRSIYSDKAIDWWSRLDASEPVEGAVRYWRRMMSAHYEASTGTIIVRVTAFAPADTLSIARMALSISEALVNRMSQRVRVDTVGFAEAEVNKAEQRLFIANQALRQLRDQEHILDPRKEAEASLALASRLRDEISRLRIELILQRSSLNENSLPVTNTKDRIAALEKELERVNSELTSVPASKAKPLSGIIGTFDQLENDRTFAEKAYQSALSSLETARMDASRQQAYLATIVQPDLPQEPSFPQPLLGTVSVLIVTLMLWGILLITIFAVREHL